MNNFPKKRTNPFAKPLVHETEEKKETVVEEPVVEPEIVETQEEIEEYVETPAPVVHTKPAAPRVNTRSTARQTRNSSRNYYQAEESVDREKYTSTMDVKLRRKIKIVCATRGIMFSEFIEMACREKLDREGER